jgi:hypothetical protein
METRALEFFFGSCGAGRECKQGQDEPCGLQFHCYHLFGLWKENRRRMLEHLLDALDHGCGIVTVDEAMIKRLG